MLFFYKLFHFITSVIFLVVFYFFHYYFFMNVSMWFEVQKNSKLISYSCPTGSVANPLTSHQGCLGLTLVVSLCDTL